VMIPITQEQASFASFLFGFLYEPTDKIDTVGVVNQRIRLVSIMNIGKNRCFFK